MKSYFEVNSVEQLCKLMGLDASVAPRIILRISLAKAIRSVIEKKKLTHAQAAEKTGVGRTVITAIVNGNLDRISTDRLLDIAQGLGLQYQLQVA